MTKKAALPIYNITPFTLLDYPHKTACIIWLTGCNMRCGYCHNPQIVKGVGQQSVDDVLAFLQKRRGLLDGVVISGGEATLYPHIKHLITQVKNLGFAVKLDTNGTRPHMLGDLLESGLLNYVALDYKAPKDKFSQVSGCKQYAKFYKSLSLLCRQKTVPFEVRTTVHTDLLQAGDINQIITSLTDAGYTGTYYIQNYIHNDERPTLGCLNKQSYVLDKSQIITPQGFELGWRNFPQTHP